MTMSFLDKWERAYTHSEEETVQLCCPICHSGASGSEHMIQHLVAQHEISKRQARFFSHKLVEWRQRGSDIIMFLQNRQKVTNVSPGYLDKPTVSFIDQHLIQRIESS